MSNAGIKYYAAGDYNKAIETLNEEIGKKPSAEASFYLGLAYGKIGKHDQEIAAFKESVKLKPKEPGTHLNLGYAYNDIGDRQKAISEIKEAIKLRPDYPNAHYKICQIYIEMGDKVNAEKEFNMLSKVDENAKNDLARAIEAM